MKLSELRGQVTVSASVKRFAFVIAICDDMYSGDRAQFIQRLARYYGVTL